MPSLHMTVGCIKDEGGGGGGEDVGTGLGMVHSWQLGSEAVMERGADEAAQHEANIAPAICMPARR